MTPWLVFCYFVAVAFGLVPVIVVLLAGFVAFALLTTPAIPKETK